MDTKFGIPGTAIRFGWDGILSILPGVGDLVGAVPAFYLIWRARSLHLPLHVLFRMVGHVVIDLVIGSIPLFGTVFDVFYKANSRNVRILRRQLEKRTVAGGA